MGETDKSNEENLEHDNRNARGGLIGGALLLYLLLLFLPLAINKWQGAFGLELKDFLTTWIALGGVVAVVFGIFQTQYRITQQQLQFDVQQKLQLKEQRDARFASGVELLGNPHESTRIGGAYNLYFLARECPDSYLNPVCEILCAHLRSIAHVDKFKTDEERAKYPRNEVQSIIDLLFKERDGETIFKDVERKNLSQIYFSNIDFVKAELMKVDFREAELKEVDFENAKLGSINFGAAKLRAADFENAELNSVSFMYAELNNVRFWKATLNHVSFLVAKLSDIKFTVSKLNVVKFMTMEEFNNIDFSNAEIVSDVDFAGTKLESIEPEEIVKFGRSLKLTSKEEDKEQEKNTTTNIDK